MVIHFWLGSKFGMKAIAIRKATIADASSIAQVHVNSWQTIYRGIISTEFLNNLTYEKQYKSWLHILREIDESHFIYLAEDERGKGVGFVFGGPERSGDPTYKGELYAIYVSKDHQGKGIGTALFCRAIKVLIQLYMPSMISWALTHNPYRKFYEKMGGKEVYSRLIKVGGREYEEIAYGWQNLRDYI